MAEATASEGILATENDEKREQIIELLENFEAEQSYLQPPEHQTDTVHVIRGVIEAEGLA
ncbi:MAG: hypothetical protein M3R23_02035 [Actinomycetota bacterium]|nr:hypothetical protein [Actinomycetota bacterium]